MGIDAKQGPEVARSPRDAQPNPAARLDSDLIKCKYCNETNESSDDTGAVVGGLPRTMDDDWTECRTELVRFVVTLQVLTRVVSLGSCRSRGTIIETEAADGDT